MKISALQSDQGMYSLIEFSDEAQFIDALGLDLNDQGGKEIIKEILSNQMNVYAGKDSANFEGVSGFILDPVLSLQEFAHHQIDIGVGINLDEPQAEHDPLALPRLVNEWGVEHIRNNYGVAVLTLFYHPEEEASLKKKQFLAEIKDYCRYEEIDLIVKLVIYTPGDREFNWDEFRKDQLQAVEELRNLADLFVLQYPNDSLACATLTTQLDVPWLISDDNIAYSEFKERLRDALENGAKGFLAGEVLFKEIEGMRKKDHSPDVENILKFITSQARDRAIELVRICKEFSQ